MRQQLALRYGLRSIWQARFLVRAGSGFASLALTFGQRLLERVSSGNGSSSIGLTLSRDALRFASGRFLGERRGRRQTSRRYRTVRSPGKRQHGIGRLRAGVGKARHRESGGGLVQSLLRGKAAANEMSASGHVASKALFPGSGLFFWSVSASTPPVLLVRPPAILCGGGCAVLVEAVPAKCLG